MAQHKDRIEAGRLLAEELDISPINFDIILAIPRGGVPVGVEIAKALQIPLNVFVARKLGAPHNAEYGIGAIAEPDIVIVDELTRQQLGISQEEVQTIITQELGELQRRVKLYREDKPLPSLKHKNVLLVDDGIATGVTAEAAVQGVRTFEPSTVSFASPVCSDSSIRTMEDLTDSLVCLLHPTMMKAVGQYYQEFEQVSDEQVSEMLKQVK